MHQGEKHYYDYANFGQRLLALIIDAAIFSVGASFTIGIFAAIFMGTAGRELLNSDGEISERTLIAGFLLYFFLLVVIMVASWLYFALQESSSKMATLGKRAVGIVVTDMDGHRLSFARATGRFFGKWLSGAIMYVGYIMAAFTEKKQALHDMIANSLVMQDH